ncbi:hypothetical protein [Mesoflavibacter zeaxanthinifaciens]|uniref:hypothetical protein n=1 Tax=Mesoflavibacter zeaxanthinifaciens TaxID=393060 RepID=UPI003A8CEA1A
MNTRKSILNRLELAYAPLTGYEFAVVKKDPLIELAMEKASLYVIGQRPIITFENVVPDSFEYALNFEIHQKGNPNILKGKLPLIQECVDSKQDDIIALAFNFLDRQDIQKQFPLGKLHGFSLAKQLPESREFLIWFSPEKLLQNWWKKQIDCEIYGDYKSFLTYKVHYVGKATKQNILKRLTGHDTFQDILSIENPITYKDLPTHEIVLLCFEFQDNLEVTTFGFDSDLKEMTATLRGENFPKQETIFLDVEKALINAMKPNYNTELFKSYPKSKDGLFKDNYDYISYSFADPITLKYSQGQIKGSLKYLGGDKIIIKENKECSLIKEQ